MFNLRNPGTGDPIKDDFRNFVYVVFKHLGLPDPTPMQYDFAYQLQHGPKRGVYEAYRGFGKSLITSAFVCWLLLNDADISVLVVSASKIRADDFTTFTLRLIYEMPVLQHLIPKSDQRQSKVAFDVGPAKAKHAPSVKSVGIFGQLSGSRADVIIPDDVEVPGNSLTQAMRDKLWEAVKEFDAILKPGDYSCIRYLGTPQSEMSLYNELEKRGYQIMIWPARIPLEDRLPKYQGRLSAYVWGLIERGMKPWQPTDPTRFGELELQEREASYGRSGFALQFMLDTSLSDAERYPLRLSDLVIMDVSRELAPAKVVWASGPDQMLADLPLVGLEGDRLYRPVFTSEEWLPYTGKVMTIDPSGRGADETGVAITYMLNGYIFVPLVVGLTGGYDEKTLHTIANLAREYGVNQILVEPNFGDGMFTELLKPVLTRVYPCAVEDAPRASVMKEARIIDTLEPVMNQHRLVVDRKLVETDAKSTEDPKYQLFYQMTRITRDRGALGKDDRLDALTMGVSYWLTVMAQDADVQLNSHREALLQAELDKFMESALGRKTHSAPSWIDRSLYG